MSFDAIRDYIRDRLENLEYAESKEPFDFDSASSREFDKNFILYSERGELLEGEDGTEYLNHAFDDVQNWVIKIGFKRSQHDDIIIRNKINRDTQDIIKSIDNPVNWSGTAGLQTLKYQNWEIEELENYYLLTINIKAVDRITY